MDCEWYGLPWDSLSLTLVQLVALSPEVLQHVGPTG